MTFEVGPPQANLPASARSNKSRAVQTGGGARRAVVRAVDQGEDESALPVPSTSSSSSTSGKEKLKVKNERLVVLQSAATHMTCGTGNNSLM